MIPQVGCVLNEPKLKIDIFETCQKCSGLGLSEGET